MICVHRSASVATSLLCVAVVHQSETQSMKLVNRRTTGILALILSGVIRWWLRTCDIRFYFDDPAGDPRGNPINGIYLFWHEMMLLPTLTHRHAGFCVLISQHRDGELISRIVTMLGFSTVRGSTTRKGFSAIRGLMREGKISHLAITPDGPKGPRRVVQQGGIYLASRTGMPILPVGLAFRSCWRANSWDRMAIPKPLTLGVIIIGKPIMIPPDIDTEEIEHHRQQIQIEMDKLQARAESRAARHPH
jgi:lysophospholipid acyltransferase (LPLAT)-like uncharacterized protein